MRTGVFLFAWASAAAAQSAPGVDDQKVKEAIARGVQWLRTAPSPGHGESGSLARNADELILLTLIHAGVPRDDAKVKELLQKILKSPLERTYSVALHAMCLEEIDRVRYQPRIVQCAQFLIDNQCTNGQWTYGEPTPATTGMPSEEPRAPVASSGGAPGLRPKVEKRVAIARTKTGPASGDNSNSQYAALGLRACHDSGVIFPRDTVYLAVKALREGQRPKGDGKGGTPTGLAPGSTPRGWCYHSPGAHKAYASMTAGAVGALVIYDHILGREWKKDGAVNDGLAWLAVNFSVTENKGPIEFDKAYPMTEYYYYLYALERAGILYGTEKIGENLWYAEGARAILASQAQNGSWSEGPPEKSWSTPTWDTCFAILFLRRATHPLTPSVDRFHAPK